MHVLIASSGRKNSLTISFTHAYTCTGESDGEEVWEEREGELEEFEENGYDVDLDIITPSVPETVSTESQTHKSLVQWLVGFLMQLRTIHRIPDSAVDLLLKFLCTFVVVVGHFSDFIKAMVPHIPSSLHRLKQAFPLQHGFKQFVVCTRCWKLYHYGECVEQSGSF